MFYSRTYVALGCDLSNLNSSNALMEVALPTFSESQVLWISEVSTCYMDTRHADRIVAWAGEHKHCKPLTLPPLLLLTDQRPSVYLSNSFLRAPIILSRLRCYDTSTS